MRSMLATGLVLGADRVATQRGLPSTETGEWPVYHGNLAQHHYSPLDQIDADNFGGLEVAWRFKTDNLGSRPEFNLEGTPLMVGGVLYATGGTRRSVVALDAATGELRWETDVTAALGAEPGKWGFAASPIVRGDQLILNVGKVVCLDKTSGELLWESRNYGHSYSTPALFDLEGEPALAVFNSGGLAILGLADGKERYLHEWKTRFDINAATPIIYGDTVSISSGLNRGCALFTDALTSEYVWTL